MLLFLLFLRLQVAVMLMYVSIFRSIFQKIKEAEEERLAKEKEESGENTEETSPADIKTESVASPTKGKPKSPKYA